MKNLETMTDAEVVDAFIVDLPMDYFNFRGPITRNDGEDVYKGPFLHVFMNEGNVYGTPYSAKELVDAFGILDPNSALTHPIPIPMLTSTNGGKDMRLQIEHGVPVGRQGTETEVLLVTGETQDESSSPKYTTAGKFPHQRLLMQ